MSLEPLYIDQHLIGLGIALGIGLLVGLEREWAEDKPIGLRSFALISLLGAVLAMLDGSPWPVAAGVLGLGVILAFTHREGHGLTTSMAALVVLALGATAASGLWLPSIVVAGVMTLLLHWKEPMHGWVERLGQQDFDTIVRFVLLAAVILPVLPNREFGPYGVLNPFEAWLLVVLIVGINISGYVALRLFGTGAGVWVAGLLGGIVSSTATTVSYATASKRIRNFGLPATLVVLVASTVIYVRVAFELAVVAPGLVAHILGPALAYSALLLVLCIAGYQLLRRASATPELPERGNPARMSAALGFAAVYVIVLLAVAAARDRIGTEAIYAVAVLSGLTDVDALTLSIGQLFDQGRIESDVAWRAIFLGSLANLAFKTAAACLLGSSNMRRTLLPFAGAALIGGIGVLLYWP